MESWRHVFGWLYKIKHYLLFLLKSLTLCIKWLLSVVDPLPIHWKRSLQYVQNILKTCSLDTTCLVMSVVGLNLHYIVFTVGDWLMPLIDTVLLIWQYFQYILIISPLVTQYCTFLKDFLEILKRTLQNF